MLPTDPKARKAIPVYSGCIAYFPDAIVAVAELSQLANEQHNPGEPLHWAKEKSTDEKDALMRHLVDPIVIGGGLYDTDRVLHATKKAWRALADLQRLLATGVARLRPEPEFRVCSECNYLVPGHYESCSKARGGSTIADSMHHMYDETGVPWGAASPIIDPPNFCTDCGADLGETGHFVSCLSRANPANR